MSHKNVLLLVLLGILSASGIGVLWLWGQTSNGSITDKARISQGTIEEVVRPDAVKDLAAIVASKSGPIAIAGAKYSQGGQTWAEGGTVIDMRSISRILDLDIKGKQITVESGITWRDILEVISPLGLSVQVMQSYYDFTVGGALSVNAHGRDIAGSIVKSVHSIKVLLADGSLVTASRTKNVDLFNAAIGGYGSCGIIVEATLSLTDNTEIRREAHYMPVSEYVRYVKNTIANNSAIALHNANVYPPVFDHALAVNWVVDNPHNIRRSNALIRPESPHLVDTCGEFMVRRFWGGKYLSQ